MITRMLKAHVVARRTDRDRLLGALGDLGVVHLAPVDPSKAVPDAETAGAIERFQRAIQILSSVEARGEPLPLGAAEAADEALRIQRQSAERSARLASLYHQLAPLELWGDARLDDFAALREAGVDLRFYALPAKSLGKVRAEFVHAIRPWPGRRVLVGVAARGEVEVPEGSEPVPLPPRDRPSIRAEAAEIDAALRRDAERLSRLAQAAPSIAAELANLKEKAAWTVATQSALAEEHLYGLQGWVPEERAAALASGLASSGVDAAVETRRPAAEDLPPTLLCPPWWARPMLGLFGILGTVPGYGEFDISAMFMIFLPIFSAILISDTGYGLLYFVLPVIFYRKMAGAGAGAAALAQLVIVIGALSLIWGAATCSFFGFDFSPFLGRTAPFIPVTMKKESMDLLMLISITLGAAHLSLAHLWKAKAAFPHPRLIGSFGWVIWMWGIYGLVRMLLLKDSFSESAFPFYPLLILIGGTCAVIFADPDWEIRGLSGVRRLVGYAGWAVWLWGLYALTWHGLYLLGKVSTDHAFRGSAWGYFFLAGGAAALLGAPPTGGRLKNLGLGLANFPLSAIGTFGDTVSYVRLMAIGMAGSALAMAFNNMGGALPWYAMIPVLMAGHALNVALSVVSLLVHGVRLNMLEFSNNLGMQWSGYRYEPFSRQREQEN